jgi:hypothetical protein
MAFELKKSAPRLIWGYLRGDGLDPAGAYAHYLFECGGKPTVRGAEVTLK